MQYLNMFFVFIKLAELRFCSCNIISLIFTISYKIVKYKTLNNPRKVDKKYYQYFLWLI